MNAKSNAKEIKYHFNLDNNTLTLDAFYITEFKNIWKDEAIEVTIFLPKDAYIFFDNSTKNFVFNIENETEIYDKDMANHHFIITDASLKCTDCKTPLEEKKDDLIKNIEVSL